MAARKSNTLPGFRLTMGITFFFLSIIVLIPFAGLCLRVAGVCWSTPALTAKNTEDLGSLVSELKRHADPASQLVWNRIPETTRQKIAATTDGTPDPAVEHALLDDLNRLVQDGSLYDNAAFADVTLSPKSRWLLKHHVSTAWLNRTLLEDAFPGSIRKQQGWMDLWLLATNDRALAAYRLTFGASAIAALANTVFGTLLAWVLVRYRFAGRRFIDAMVDFPFALPTAVAGLTLSNLFSAKGWLGQYLVPLGIHGSRSQLGVVIALTFVGMPFVVRTLQPVLEHFEREVEEAAATLGARRLRTVVSVIAPSLFPAIVTGFALAFARAIGEYGSVVFISNNQPFSGEIAPFLIWIRLEEYDYTGAMALAVVLLIFSFVLLAVINLLEQWASRFQTH